MEIKHEWLDVIVHGKMMQINSKGQLRNIPRRKKMIKGLV